MTMSNGHGPDVNGLEDSIVDDLRKLVAVDDEAVATLTDELAAAKTQRDRHRKALADLTGLPAKKAAAKPGEGHGWQISDERVEFVFNQLREQLALPGAPESITPTQLSDKIVGVSGETVRKAFEVLRSQERIRLAGAARGGGKLYTLMPEAETADAT
jgi:hypothetical protein